MQHIYLILFLTALYFLVRFWDKKRKKDKLKEHEELKNWMLDDTERYIHDEREVEYYKK